MGYRPINKRKEFVDKALNHIRENSVYGIPKEPKPTFVDIQPIKDNTKYTKELDLSTGKVTVVKEPEKKLEPGCDKCEISECKFLEDPFMNPPYNVLWDKWKEQKETIEKLLREKKEMQDSIDILTDDKKKLKECIALEKITEIVPKVCKTCKHENDTCSDECTYSNPVEKKGK